MSETTIYWPEAALGCPLRNTYAGQADARFAVSEVVDGPPRFRLLSSDERRQWNVSFVWTWEQVQVFEGFVAADLNMGLGWFRMNHLTGQGMVEHFCHLIGDYSIRAAGDSATHFEVAFQVEAFRNWHGVPPDFVFDAGYDGGLASAAPPVDVVDGREASDPPPPDRIDALVPGT